MRALTTALLVVVALFLGVISAHATSKTSNRVPADSLEEFHSPTTDILRFLRASNQIESNEDEERTMNLGFLKNLKQKLPGTGLIKSAKTALAAKKAAAAAKKAKKKAAELEFVEMFNLKGDRHDHLFPKFEAWHKAELDDKLIVESLGKFAGKTQKEADDIMSLFIDWRMVKTKKFLIDSRVVGNQKPSY